MVAASSYLTDDSCVVVNEELSTRTSDVYKPGRLSIKESDETTRISRDYQKSK